MSAARSDATEPTNEAFLTNPPAALVEEGHRLMLVALEVAWHVERLHDEIQRLEGAMELFREDDAGVDVEVVNARDTAWAVACNTSTLYQALGAITGKIGRLTGSNSDDSDWSWWSLASRFGLLDEAAEHRRKLRRS